MKTRPGDSLTEGIEYCDRPEEVLEREVHRTERAIHRFREEYVHLLRDVHRDVEKLCEAGAGLPPEPGLPGYRGHDRFELRIEERFEALNASLPGRVADLVAAELAGPNVQAALRHLVDIRLRAVTEAIGRISGDPAPKKEIGRRRSRRFR
jgi:hypothetical protein